MAFTTSGGLGEAEVGGPIDEHRAAHRRQHDAGHLLRRQRARLAWSAATITDGLRDRGLSTPGDVLKLWDHNLGDRRPDLQGSAVVSSPACATRAAYRQIPGMFANKNAGDPTKWTYEPDTSRPAVQRRQLDDR